MNICDMRVMRYLKLTSLTCVIFVLALYVRHRLQYKQEDEDIHGSFLGGQRKLANLTNGDLLVEEDSVEVAIALPIKVNESVTEKVNGSLAGERGFGVPVKEEERKNIDVYDEEKHIDISNKVVNKDSEIKANEIVEDKSSKTEEDSPQRQDNNEKLDKAGEERDKKEVLLKIADDILHQINAINNLQKIENLDLYGPITNKTVVIVIQVHNRINYLRELIMSMSRSQGIDKCLLIFSHDLWDKNINELVRSIDFAPWMQIFYPFSLQTHPFSFPGQESTDCPKDVKKEKALQMGCVNAKFPDAYGHFREAKITQTKHHWWWKANYVFNHLKDPVHFTGTFLFLEEDHYLAPDALHVLNLLIKEKNKLFHKVDIISLGTYLKTVGFDGKKVEVTQWISSKHNMGMAFTRIEWKKIVDCKDVFCKYDDYNWDWSLQFLSFHCIKENLQVMMIKGPRVFHIGECGVHHKKKDCDNNPSVKRVQSIISTEDKKLFPESLIVVKGGKQKSSQKKNGGWGDERDYQFCLNMTMV